MKKTILLCILSIFVFSLHAEKQVLNIAAFKGPTGLGMVKLFEDKPDLGPTVSTEYTAYASPDVLIPRMIKKEVDFAAMPTSLAVNLYNKKVPYVLAAVIGNGVLYLLSSDPKVSSFESLGGGELQNVAKGSTPEFILRYLLEKKGMTDKVRVEFKYAPVELAQTLIAGREKTGILPEPFVTKALSGNPSLRVVSDLQTEWSRMNPDAADYPMSVLVVKAELLQSRPEVVRAFLEKYRESQDWVKANPRAAGVLAEKFAFGLSASDAEEAIPRCNLTYVEAAAAKPYLDRFLSVFLRFAPESLGGRLPDDGFYAAF